MLKLNNYYNKIILMNYEHIIIINKCYEYIELFIFKSFLNHFLIKYHSYI